MSPADFLRDYFAVWFAALALLIGYRLLTGQINLAGVLTVDRETFSPARLQLLITTVSTAAAYAVASLTAHRMVSIPDSLVGLFALSHGSYLGAKGYLLRKNTN